MLIKLRGFLSTVITIACLVSCAAHARASEEMTPLLLAVHDAPVPFTGSDGRTHLVYELWMTNFSSADARLDKVEVLSGNTVIETLDADAIKTRLQPAGVRLSTPTLSKSTQALLFLHVTLASGSVVPARLSHRVTTYFAAAPPGHQEIVETGGATAVDHRTVARIAPPLSGERYISADSCCDATRHTRAALPINGRVWLAQRYAVDWEQLDTTNHIYTGASEKPESYTIFGKQVLAVADATVESVVDGQPEQIPGHYPIGITPAMADGNSVILKLSDHIYALYAHMQPNSIKVKQGDRVKPGQVIGLVGNTGNSVAPHLHFQLMDGPSSLASNGLPYEIDSFVVTATSPGTEAFDASEGKGVPLATAHIAMPQQVKDSLPLDQLIISFAPQK
jgi:hypothetical protein